MSQHINRKDASHKREFLDITGEKDSKGVEDLVLVVGQSSADESKLAELRRQEERNQDQLPPWKRKPLPLDDGILKRTKNFLSLCKTVGSERVGQDCDQDKQVVMNVHMGVFDINGKLPESDSFPSKEVVEVPEINLESIQHGELCRIEQEDDDEVTDEDEVSGPSFSFDPNSTKSLEEQEAIYNLLSSGNRSTNKSSKNKDLVQVISFTDN